MEKFQWSLMKTLEFVNSRRPDLEIRANFLHQLQQYTKRSKTTILTDESKEKEAASEAEAAKAIKIQRTDEFSDSIVNLKMYRNLKKATHADLMDQLQAKAKQERTICNTFLNTQNLNEVEDEDDKDKNQKSLDDEKKLLKQQLMKIDNKLVKF